MRLVDRFLEALTSLTAVPALARSEHVAALVPPDAEYVTAGLFLVLADARGFVGGEPGRQPYRRTTRLPPSPNPADEAGLLVLRPQRLSVFDLGGERWSVDPSQITDLDGHRHSGFVVITRNGTGVALSWQAPVPVPPGAGWTSVPRTTNAFSGWDEVLERFGPRVHW